MKIKMSLSGKIMTISCRIDLGAIEPVSNSLIFQTIVPNGRTFYATQRFNQFNFGHYKKWVIDVGNNGDTQIVNICLLHVLGT